MVDMKELELRECPFCGSEARIYGTGVGILPDCSNADCPVNESWFYGSDEAVIKAWNTRASDAQISTLTAQLKEAREWRPIETAPKDGTLILGYGSRWPLSKRYDIDIIRWIDDEDVIEMPGFSTGQIAPYPPGTHKLMSFGIDDFFSHWMPLPLAPVEAALKQEEL